MSWFSWFIMADSRCPGTFRGFLFYLYMKIESITFKAQEKSLYYMEKTFKKPDLNGRRRRRETFSVLSTEYKLLEMFKKKYPEYKNVTKEEFAEVIYTFNKVLWEEVIDNEEGIELPEGLGEVYIVSIKGKPKRIDMVKSAIVGSPVYHRNMHTEGHFCDIFYTNQRHKYKFANRNLLKFIGHRDFKRTASKVFSTDWMKYRLMKEFSDMTQKHKNIDRMIKGKEYRQKEIIDDTYNEFDLD